MSGKDQIEVSDGEYRDAVSFLDALLLGMRTFEAFGVWVDLNIKSAEDPNAAHLQFNSKFSKSIDKIIHYVSQNRDDVSRLYRIIQLSGGLFDLSQDHLGRLNYFHEENVLQHGINYRQRNDIELYMGNVLSSIDKELFELGSYLDRITPNNHGPFPGREDGEKNKVLRIDDPPPSFRYNRNDDFDFLKRVYREFTLGECKIFSPNTREEQFIKVFSANDLSKLTVKDRIYLKGANRLFIILWDALAICFDNHIDAYFERYNIVHSNKGKVIASTSIHQERKYINSNKDQKPRISIFKDKDIIDSFFQ